MNARISRKKRSRARGGHFVRNVFLLALLLGGASFLIGYGVTALSFANTVEPSDVLVVPDVRKMQADDARQMMERAGLTVQVGDSFPNPDIPAGAVLAQTPLPGEEVAPGTDVRLIVSTGRVRLEVPNVASMPVSLATRTLEAAGFAVAIDEEFAEGDSGQVVLVTPPPGTQVELPDTILLQLGGLVTYVPMPTLVGLRADPARATAEALGLIVGSVVYEPSDFGEPGGVIAQVPAPGDSVAVGSEIELHVTAPRGEDRPDDGDPRDRFDFDDGRSNRGDRSFGGRDRSDRGSNQRGRFR